MKGWTHGEGRSKMKKGCSITREALKLFLDQSDKIKEF
jgi:hypothetical protein